MGRKYPKEFQTSTNGRAARLYSIWYDMHKRCKEGAREKDRANYFDKGITVCNEWAYWPTFAAWARDNGYAPDLEIDRINNKLGYGPSNCRFSSENTQAKNKYYVFMRALQRKVHSSPFICVQTGDIFDTQAEAHEATGVDRTSLNQALNGKQATAGGFTWSRLIKLEDAA